MEILIKNVIIGSYTGDIVKGYYLNGKHALIFQNESGKIANLTVNLPTETMLGRKFIFGTNEIYLNSNISVLPIQEIIEVLKNEKIIEETGSYINSGYCQYPIVVLI